MASVIRRGSKINQSVNPSITTAKKTDNRTVVLVGDSITARNWRQLSTGLALSVSGTTCTCTLTNHGAYTGAVIRYVDRGESGLMGTYVITGLDGSDPTNKFTFTVPSGTPASPTVANASVLLRTKKGDDGFFNYANALLGQRFTEVNNFGVPGDQTSHLLKRMGEILDSGGSRAILLIGTNDARNGVSISTYSTNLELIVDQLLNAGMLVDICTVPPCTGTPNTGTVASMNQLILGYNKYINTLVRNDPRLMRHDIYSVLTDPTSTTAAWASGMNTTDNVHFSPLGSITAGRVLYSNYKNVLNDSGDKISSMSDSYAIDNTNTQILANPLMTGTGGTLSGGATGTVPDSWTVTMTSATSVVASITSRTDGIGSDLYGVMTASSSSSRMRFDSESLTSKLVVNGQYVLQGDVSIDTSSVISTMKFELQVVTTSGSVAVLYCGIVDVGNGNATSSGELLTFRSNVFTLPVALSTATVRLDVFASGAGTVGCKLGRVSLTKVN